MKRTLVGAVLLFLAGLGYSQFQLQSYKQLNARSLGNGNIAFTYLLYIKNENREEVMNFDLLLTIKDLMGNLVYRSPAQTISKVANSGYPHTGSVLAMNRVQPFEITFIAPSKYWRTDTILRVALGRNVLWDHHGDLNDMGHFHTWLNYERDPAIMAYLDKNPSLLKAKNAQGFNPLMAAFSIGNPVLVNYMLKKGMSMKTTCTTGHNMMFFATMGGNPELLETARKAGLSVNSTLVKSKRTPLMKAVYEGRYSSVEWLLSHGAKPDMADVDGMTAMSYAIVFGMEPSINMLADAGANLKYRDPYGNGYMHTAVQNYFMIPRLKALGADVNARNNEGLTPLMVAARAGDDYSARILVENGAEVSLKSKAGLTARDYSKLSNTLGTDRYFVSKVNQALAKLRKPLLR